VLSLQKWDLLCTSDIFRCLVEKQNRTNIKETNAWQLKVAENQLVAVDGVDRRLRFRSMLDFTFLASFHFSDKFYFCKNTASKWHQQIRGRQPFLHCGPV